MARARNIKHGFFTNDRLAECEPLARLLFAGLWCIADRAGRLEDRPKKIEAELLPYDDCDIESLLTQLQKRRFIVRYEAGDEQYIQIVNFDKHQHPHIKEPESKIPAPDMHGKSTVHGALMDGVDPVAWSRWIAYRAQIKKPIKPASIDAAQRKLAAFGKDQAAIVEQSIANGWQGLFALSNGGSHGNRNGSGNESRGERSARRLDEAARKLAAQRGEDYPDAMGEGNPEPSTGALRPSLDGTFRRD